MTKYVAVGFRVHVKPDESETEKYAREIGIDLPENARSENRKAVSTGTVLAVGPEAFKAYGGDPWCKEGDRVVFVRYSGYSVGEKDDKMLVINDEDVVTKLEAESV